MKKIIILLQFVLITLLTSSVGKIFGEMTLENLLNNARIHYKKNEKNFVEQAINNATSEQRQLLIITIAEGLERDGLINYGTKFKKATLKTLINALKKKIAKTPDTASLIITKVILKRGKPQEDEIIETDTSLSIENQTLGHWLNFFEKYDTDHKNLADNNYYYLNPVSIYKEFEKELATKKAEDEERNRKQEENRKLKVKQEEDRKQEESYKAQLKISAKQGEPNPGEKETTTLQTIFSGIYDKNIKDNAGYITKLKAQSPEALETSIQSAIDETLKGLKIAANGHTTLTKKTLLDLIEILKIINLEFDPNITAITATIESGGKKNETVQVSYDLSDWLEFFKNYDNMHPNLPDEYFYFEDPMEAEVPQVINQTDEEFALQNLKQSLGELKAKLTTLSGKLSVLKSVLKSQ